MSGVAEALAAVRHRVDEAARAAGRDPGTVRLMAVSKTFPVEDVHEAAVAGQALFGENRPQDLAAKAEATQARHLTWAQIGALQSNKIGLVARWAAEFHALATSKVATGLQRRLAEHDRRLRVCVQVNTSGEASKEGLAPDDVAAFARSLVVFDRLDVVGLMTIAHPDPARAPGCFATLAELAERLRHEAAEVGAWRELSMGMSGDLEAAVAAGATTVRVGSAIFGTRAPRAPGAGIAPTPGAQ